MHINKGQAEMISILCLLGMLALWETIEFAILILGGIS
jgi:hypothetical protein